MLSICIYIYIQNLKEFLFSVEKINYNQLNSFWNKVGGSLSGVKNTISKFTQISKK